jgi:thiopurine S-methyltransferase
MNPEYWISRWEKGEIGFHAAEVQPGLLQALQAVPVPAPGNILVPLCGKTFDMKFLADAGWNVTGIELSERACRAFFEENGLVYEIAQLPGMLKLTSGNITLFAGDLFHMKKNMLPSFDLVYDRAALVALPQAMRRRYVQKLSQLAGAVPHVVISFTYNGPEGFGPPFSVAEPEIKELYGTENDVRKLAVRVLYPEKNSKMAVNGIFKMQETTYIMVPTLKIP